MNITLKALKKSLSRSFCLQVDDFSIDEGKHAVCILGPNGSGKTTFLKTLLFLLAPDTGKIYVDGIDVNPNKIAVALRRRISAAMHNPHLISGTVKENLIYGLLIRDIKRETADKKAEVFAEHFGIDDLSDLQVSKLSRGQAQKVGIVRALLVEPEILFLDEPFGSIDPGEGEEFKRKVFSFCRERKITVVFTTHQIEEAVKYGEYLVVFNEGKIVQEGVLDSVLSSPDNGFVANFLGIGNFFFCTIKEVFEDHSVGVIPECGPPLAICGDGGWSSGNTINIVFLPGKFTPGERLSFFVSPDAVIVSKSEDVLHKTSIRNIWGGVVTKLIAETTRIKIEVRCPQPLAVHITRDALRELEIGLGERVYIGFKSSAIKII